MPEAPPQRRGQLGKAGSDRPRRARAPSFDPRVTAPTWRRPGLPARPQRPAPRESRGETRCPAPRDGPASGRGGRESSHFYWLFPRAGSQSCPRLPGSSLSSVICFLHRSFFFFFPPVLLLSLPSASVFCLLASSVFFSHLSHFFLPIFLLLVSPVLPFLCFFFFFSPSLSLSSPLLPFFLPPIKNSALDFSARSTFLGCNSFNSSIHPPCAAPLFSARACTGHEGNNDAFAPDPFSNRLYPKIWACNLFSACCGKNT